MRVRIPRRFRGFSISSLGPGGRPSISRDTTRLELPLLTVALGKTSCPRSVLLVHRCNCIFSRVRNSSVSQLSNRAIDCARDQPDSARRSSRPHSLSRSQTRLVSFARRDHRRDWILYILTTTYSSILHTRPSSLRERLVHLWFTQYYITRNRFPRSLTRDRPQHCQALFTSLRDESSKLPPRRATGA